MSNDRGPRARRHASETKRSRPRWPKTRYVFWAAGAVLIAVLIWLGVTAAQMLAPAGNSVTVPTFIGMQFGDAVDKANGAHLRLHIVARKPDYHAPKDEVVGQLPVAGEHVREGRIVDVVVSIGEPTARVPNVANMSVRDATVTLENARLDVGAITSQSDAEVAEGTVLAQKPEALSDVAAGTKVALTVAKGRPVAYAPNFVGMSIGAANVAAKDAHVAMTPAVLMPLAPSAPPRGIVVAQDPPAGQQMKPHQTITLQVSGGRIPTPPPSPSPSPENAAAARSASPGPTATSLLPAPTTPRGIRVSVALPSLDAPARVRVVLLDAAGSRTLYDQQTRGGFTLSFDVTVTGAGTLQTYVADQLVNSTPL